jgi:ParB family chromosome partitioning protein
MTAIPREIPGKVTNIPVEMIVPSPYQRRTQFDEDKLTELANSIKQMGLMQPVTVRERPAGYGYELIAGERRLRASRQAEIETIPAIILQVDDATAAELCITENLQRDNLNAIEEAHSFRALLDLGITEDTLGERLHLSQPYISNRLRLLNLPDQVQQMITDGQLSPSHGKALARFTKYPEICTAIARDVVSRNIASKTLEGLSLQSCIQNINSVSSKLAVEFRSYSEPKTHFNYETVCKGCEHYCANSGGWHSYCLKPSCHHEKETAWKEQERERVEQIISEQTAGSDQAEEVLNAKKFKYNDYQRLVNGIPDGCASYCVNRRQMTFNGQVEPVCMDPQCYEKLRKAQEEKKRELRQLIGSERLSKSTEHLFSEINDRMDYTRVLAMTIVYVRRLLNNKKHLTKYGEMYGIKQDTIQLLTADYHEFKFDACLNSLEQYSAETLLQFTGMLIIGTDINEWAHSDYHPKTPYADWYLNDKEAFENE